MRFLEHPAAFLAGLYGLFLTFWGAMAYRLLGDSVWILTGITILWGLSLIWLLAAAVFCARQANRQQKAKELSALVKMAGRLKLGTIPFFILNFLFWLILGAGFMIATRGLLIVFSIPVWMALAGLTYVLLLYTGWFSVNALALAARMGCLTKRRMAFGILGQLVFVVDIAAWLLCSRRIKKALGGDTYGIAKK